MDLTKSYAENNGVHIPMNWNLFLDRENINEDSWLAATSAANKWVTCACGVQCSIIPRRENGKPIDYTLRTLGIAFNFAIKSRDKKWAKQTLQEIEIRSAQLIKEITDKTEPI